MIALAPLLCAALAAAPAAPSSAPQAQIQTPGELRIDRELSASKELALESGQNRLLIISEEIGRVSVADPNVADLKVVTPTQLLLTAREVGNTDLTLWNRENKPLVVSLRVARNLDGLRGQLKELFPGETIKLSTAGDLLVLEGQVSDLRVPERVAEVARLHSRQVANLLQVTGNQQVQLEVRFAEVSRNALKEMGANFFHKRDGLRSAGMTGPGTSPGAFLNSQTNPSIPWTGVRSATGQPPDVYAPVFNNAYSLFFSSFDASAFPFSVTLNLLQENGLAKVLAEPTLVTLTGQEAKFLAGGEVPIPVTSALGQVNVIWKKFGILLNFTPTVIGQDTIHLKMATEVSELDPTLQVTVAGSSIPGFSARQGETTVRLGDGQSFAIAGLLSDKTRSSVSKVPLLGSIPILGALFRSTSYQRNETELMVVITARLARPVAPHELPPLPTDEVRPPSDWQIFLLGAQQGTGSGAKNGNGRGASGKGEGAKGGTNPSGPVGFQR